jgi:hypothetical protein
MARLGQALDRGWRDEVDDEPQRRTVDAGDGQDAEAANLDSAGDRGRRGHRNLVAIEKELSLVVCHEASTLIDQPQGKVRFSAPRRTAQ